jgi:acyl carrier protein
MSAAEVFSEPDHGAILDAVRALLEGSLLIEVPDSGADLFAGGQLDSLGLVELLVLLEERFDVVIPPADLDVDSFRSVDAIAALVARLRAPSDVDRQDVPAGAGVATGRAGASVQPDGAGS